MAVALALSIGVSSLASGGSTGPARPASPSAPPPLTVRPSNCASFAQTVENTTLRGNCAGFFEADYRSFSPTSGWSTDNLTFTVGPLVELGPTESVLALAGLSSSSGGSVIVTTVPDEVNVTDEIPLNVTDAIGVNASNHQPDGKSPTWSPADLPGVGETTWAPGDEVLGTTDLSVVFHLASGSLAGTSRVKFDISVAGWPWVSPADALGLAVAVQSDSQPIGVHFVYVASNDTIWQVRDRNDGAASSLSFGPTARATGPSPGSLGVSDQFGVVSPTTNYSTAYALLTFGGPGGYTGLTYDPWIAFGVPGPVLSNAAPPPSHDGGASLPWIAVGGIAAAVGGLGAIAYQVRRRPVEFDLVDWG
jgi:hypothetical protein